MFAAGYASAVLAAFASGSKHATPWMLLTMLAYWPLQSWTMLRALVAMKLKPHFWDKTQDGVSFATDRPIPSPAPQRDNVIQPEFSFQQPDAASRQLAGGR